MQTPIICSAQPIVADAPAAKPSSLAAAFPKNFRFPVRLAQGSGAVRLVAWLGLLLCGFMALGLTEVAAQELRGTWYDAESRGWYEFLDEEKGDFIFHAPDGKTHKGTFEEIQMDNDGHRQFRAEILWEGDEEPSRVFIKIMADGKRGYMHYKCRKFHFFRFEQS